MATTNSVTASPMPANTSSVANPRLMPFLNSQFTAGSIANDKKNETRIMTSRLFSWSSSHWAMYSATMPAKKSTMALGTQRGILSRSDITASSLTLFRPGEAALHG